jgi:Leucine-rich repeat (LRR) protein
MRSLSLIVLLLLVLGVTFVRPYDSEFSDESSRGGDDEATAGGGTQLNCVFLGCSCAGVDEPVLTGESGDYTAGADSPYGNGYDVTCSPPGEEGETSGGRVFPERDTSRKYSNVISSIEASANDIAEIPDDRFAELEISVADFNGNQLESLSRNVFRGIRKLEVLDLSKNRLGDLNEETFSPIQVSLVQLKLNRNSLSRMNAQKLSVVLSNLHALKTLELRHNELTELPDLSNNNALEEISLAHNQIESIYDEASGKQLLPRNTSDLNLESNRLKHLHENTFAGLKNLKYLNLEANQIATIDDKAFEHLTRLATLNLGKNYIKHIPSLIFYRLVNLDRLDLSAQNQMLKEIDDYAFDRSSNAQTMRRVDLSKNRIARISNRAFCSRNHTYPYVNVREIDLAANHLTGLNACILRQLSKGFSEFQSLKISQSVSIQSSGNQQALNQRPKLSFKPVHFAEKVGPHLKCDCEITKAHQYVDFDGECELSQGQMTDLKNYQCQSLAGLTSENIEQECSSQPELDCHQRSVDESSSSGGNEASETTRESDVVNPVKPIKPGGGETDAGVDNSNKKEENKPDDKKGEERVDVATKSPSSVANPNGASVAKLGNGLVSSSALCLLTLLLSSTILVWL